jgi:hypothetical protein
MRHMKKFLPPPVTPSERNRSPRAVCRLCNNNVVSGVPRGGKTLRMGMVVLKSPSHPDSRTVVAAKTKHNRFLPPLMTPLVEEPIGMGGW